MDIDSALKSVMEFDIKKHCHVNSNEDGDRFVGIKADSDNAMVYFPIGYELPVTDAEIRTDIKDLIQILSEFTTKDDRLLALNRFAAPQSVDFPINAYKSVIEYYFSIGGNYYIETDPTYKTAPTGKQDWPKTIKKKMPLVQSKNGISSFIFTDFVVRSTQPNDTKLITQINRYCVFEAFKRLGWLYVPFMPEEPGPHPDVKTSISIVQDKYAETNDDKKKNLFRGMLDMLEYMDEKTSDKQFYFGTDDFDHVWEKLIDRAFGEPDKDKYFPRSRWFLDYGKYKEKRPLMPDTIMIYNSKYYVLDAKCYKYGWTGRPDHLPNASSINKQITYGEYLERYKGVNPQSLFNAFIMPFNMATNFFNITEPVGTIGEAVGDWRGNTKYYERIQGIVMDTRYLMHHYVGKPEKERNALAECIEAVTTRPPIPSAPDQHKVINYSYYMQPRPLMVAESPTPYGTDSET
ncbi:LlaJI family restriction endonuclease [Schaedlerella arabinosiphila]|uniref:LlaJI family restriction endonuclease n=1 Tax=Schaedlerella arabinosiphila TaxID=2044587 RepID=UPI002557F106|nr:LlaJI family restriction endonuclease [Schaedlerella arabinosiphila]